VAGAVLAAPVALPVLPARALHTVPLQKIDYDLGEEIAWPRLVALVAREYDAVPAAQRARTTILAGNYGEAGAIERYGRGDGLPQVHSGANNFWIWGPPLTPRRSRSTSTLLSSVASSPTSAASPRSGTASASTTTSRERRSISPPG